MKLISLVAVASTVRSLFCRAKVIDAFLMASSLLLPVRTGLNMNLNLICWRHKDKWIRRDECYRLTVSPTRIGFFRLHSLSLQRGRADSVTGSFRRAGKIRHNKCVWVGGSVGVAYCSLQGNYRVSGHINERG